jgi:hypothetical protein
MEKKLLIIGLIIILVLGAAFFGYVLGYNQIQLQIDSSALELLSSKLVRDINVSIRGRIANISDKTITIEDNGVSLDLTIPEHTSIMKQPVFSREESVSPTPEKIKLEDLKTGNSVNANISLDNNGKIVGLVIVVLPESSPSSSAVPEK